MGGTLDKIYPIHSSNKNRKARYLAHINNSRLCKIFTLVPNQYLQPTRVFSETYYLKEIKNYPTLHSGFYSDISQDIVDLFKYILLQF